MTLHITKLCVKCDLCIEACPKKAIKFKNKKYTINKNICTECIGYYNQPQCKKICPIKNAIIKYK